MDRRAFLKGTAGNPRQPISGAPRLPHLPGFVDAAVAQTRAPLNASRLAGPSVQQAPPSAPRLMTDPGDLVARALAILAEEDEAWQARRFLNPAPRSIR